MTAICMMFGLSAQSQQPNPIRWRTVVKMTSPTEGTVTVKALIDSGWHLYGFTMPDAGPRPTKLDFSSSQGVEMIGAPVPSRKPEEKHDTQFDATLPQWSENVNFVQKFRVKDAAKAKIGVAIQYMGCNDVTCLPPRTENVSAPVPAFKK